MKKFTNLMYFMIIFLLGILFNIGWNSNNLLPCIVSVMMFLLIELYHYKKN